MKDKIYSLPNNLILFLSILILTFVFCMNNAYSHKKEVNGKMVEHKPITCKPPEKRNVLEKKFCEMLFRKHTLCKLDQHCKILEIQELQKENAEQVEKLAGIGDCGDMPFNHKASTNSKIHIKANKNSKVIASVKKNQALLFYAVSTKNKKFSRVKIRTEGICAEGYIESKFLVKNQEEDVVVKVGPKLIEIIDPSWAKEGKLILVDAKGRVSIIGAIQEGKIDQIIINDEEELINSDNTFSFSLFVKSDGAEVRIIGNKNGKKVKELIFKVRVGN